MMSLFPKKSMTIREWAYDFLCAPAFVWLYLAAYPLRIEFLFRWRERQKDGDAEAMLRDDDAEAMLRDAEDEVLKGGRLLPATCPRCRHRVVLHVGATRHFVMCPNDACFISGPLCDSPEEALKDWALLSYGDAP